MTGFQTLKYFVISHTGLAKDALHIYVALGLFLGACLVFGWKTHHWKPWLMVLLAGIGGEFLDIYQTMQSSSPIRPLANFHDIWNTMLAPTILLLLSRYSTVFSTRADTVTGSENSGNQP